MPTKAQIEAHLRESWHDIETGYVTVADKKTGEPVTCKVTDFGLSRDKRRSYKCALREIEGAYEKGKEPSVKGLAEAKDFGKKKRKADEEAPEDIKAVPADEMAALVFKMKTYAGAALCVPRHPA